MGEGALRASIRAAVERAHLEGIGEPSGNAHTQSNPVHTNPLEASSELVSELSSHLSSQIAAETVQTSSFLGGAFPLVAGIALVSALVVGVLFWQIRTRNAEGASKLGVRSSSDSTALAPNAFAQQNIEQGRVAENPSTEAKTSERSFNPSQTGALSNNANAPIYDNAEEPYSNNTNSPANINDHKNETTFDVEMNEQERHRDSLSTQAQLSAKKRDAANQRRHDLLLLLVARTREHVVNPHHYILKGVPCSLPVAMKGETSPDCILTMLEQQSLLLHDTHLNALIQQARREKSLPSLAVLENYIKEHY